MWPRSASRPSETSIALRARPRSRPPSSIRGSGDVQALEAGLARFALELDAALKVGERKRRLAGRAREPYVVARKRPVAPEREPGGHLADHRNRDREGALGRVSADELDSKALGKREEALRERGDPFFVGIRERDCEQRPARVGAHRGEIREIDGERLVPELARIRPREEMASGEQHVGRDRKNHPGLGREQGAVVAHSEHCARRRPGEILADDLELGGHVVQAFLSSGRNWEASLSSTPFTYL